MMNRRENILALKAEKESAEELMGRALYRFRNGYAVDPDLLTELQDRLADFIMIVGRGVDAPPNCSNCATPIPIGDDHSGICRSCADKESETY